MTARPDAQRDQMNAVQAALRRATRGEFEHDGLIYRGVPAAALHGFVAGRFDGAVSDLHAVLDAFLGPGVAVGHDDDPDWLGWRVARAWVAALTAADVVPMRRAA